MEILDTASSLENTISFDAAEIGIVKVALKTKLFKRDESVEVRTAKFAALINALAEKFGVPQLALRVEEHEQAGFAKFDPETNTVVINRRFSLTNTLCAFGSAMMHHKPELVGEAPTDMAGLVALMGPGRFNPMSFALSLFKQAAPIMFDSAKAAGRLTGTNVPYTDGGRMTAESSSEFLGNDDGEHDDDNVTDNNHPAPPQAPRAPRPTPPQSADVDPENRRDRGNGLGED